MRFADVVERQHYQRKKENCWNRCDPISMANDDSVLRGCRSVTHHLQRSEIRGNEAESCYPGRHFPASHKEFFSVISKLLQVQAQSKDENEIQYDDGQVDGPERQ